MNFKCSKVIMAEKNHRQSSVRTVLDRGVQKEAKICVVCERLFTWRKKWERNWAEVTTCSERCKRERKQRQKQKKSETTIWMRPALKGISLKMCGSCLLHFTVNLWWCCKVAATIFLLLCKTSGTHSQCFKMLIVSRKGLHQNELFCMKIWGKLDIKMDRNQSLTEGK